MSEIIIKVEAKHEFDYIVLLDFLETLLNRQGFRASVEPEFIKAPQTFKDYSVALNSIKNNSNILIENEYRSANVLTLTPEILTAIKAEDLLQHIPKLRDAALVLLQNRVNLNELLLEAAIDVREELEKAKQKGGANAG